MPWIPPQILNCVVYVYRDEESAREGEGAGASGFLVGVPAMKIEGAYHIYAVTNRHVIDQGSVIRLNTVDGVEVLPYGEENWIKADIDDLAVSPVALNRGHKHIWITSTTFVTEKFIESYNVGCGDDVFMVGRFTTHGGRQTNMPSARFGHISMMPCEKVRHYNEDVDAFLVEVKSIGGFSGSPVFFYDTPYMPRSIRVPETTTT